nr:MAG TPA: hypothetical protein [Caudoviricetes sp.]
MSAQSASTSVASLESAERPEGAVERLTPHEGKLKYEI